MSSVFSNNMVNIPYSFTNQKLSKKKHKTNNKSRYKLQTKELKLWRKLKNRLHNNSSIVAITSKMLSPLIFYLKCNIHNSLLLVPIQPHRTNKMTKIRTSFLTMYLASMKGSFTATTSISSLVVAMRKTSLPIRPKPVWKYNSNLPELCKKVAAKIFNI